MSGPYFPHAAKEMLEPTEPEREEILAFARGKLEWAKGLHCFLIGANRQLVALYRPCELELETARAWFDHCEEHGFPRMQDIPESYPPRPHRGGGVWVGLTWKAIRKELRGEAVRQMGLLELAA